MKLRTTYIKSKRWGLIPIYRLSKNLSLSKGSLLKSGSKGTQIIIESANVKKAPYRTYTTAEIDDFFTHD